MERTDGESPFLPVASASGARRLTLAVAAVVSSGAVALIGLLTVRGNAWWESDQSWSRQVFDFGHRHQTLTTAAEWVGHLTIPTVLRVLTLICAVVLWRRGRRAEALWWSATMIIGGAVAIALREAVARPRPHWPGSGPVVEGYTYPSGHATSAAVFAGCVLVVLWPHVGRTARVTGSFVALLFFVAVGISRLLLGVHSVMDVIAAWALAAALLFALLAFFAEPAVRRSGVAIGTRTRKLIRNSRVPAPVGDETR